jgi:hypothetical protein
MGFVFTPLDKTVKNLHDHVNNVVQEYETWLSRIEERDKQHPSHKGPAWYACLSL